MYMIIYIYMYILSIHLYIYIYYDTHSNTYMYIYIIIYICYNTYTVYIYIFAIIYISKLPNGYSMYLWKPWPIERDALRWFTQTLKWQVSCLLREMTRGQQSQRSVKSPTCYPPVN